MLAEPGIELDGKIVGRPPETGRWFLYKVEQPLRYAYNETGIFADGQTGCDRAPCPTADSAYNRFSTPGQKPGYAIVDVSRLSACGAPVPPAGVRVTIGKLVEGRDKQPHIGRVTAPVQRWTLRIGSARRFVLPTPKPPFRVEVQDRADVRAVELRRLRPAPARRPGRLRLLAQEGAADRDAATM